MIASKIPMSRTSATEKEYTHRVALAIQRMTPVFGHTPTPLEAVSWLAGNKPRWSRATWRKMRAAFLFWLDKSPSRDMREAAMLLREETSDGCRKRGRTSSSLRIKNNSEQRFAAILQALAKMPGTVAAITRIWMILGDLTGLRPHEWCHASIVEDEGKLLLRVRNSKNTNNRAHGTFRHLDISDIDTAMQNSIRLFAGSMAEIHHRGEYPRCYDACRKLLLRLNKRLYPYEQQRVQLYTARHRFTSEMKTRFTLPEIAAMMGHATDRTATLHYARPASRGRRQVRPISQEVQRIRSVRGTSTPKPLPKGQTA